MTWLFMALVLGLAVFWVAAKWARRTDDGRVRAGAGNKVDHTPGHVLNSNPTPTQTEQPLWPDRTGAQTRRELGARHAVDISFDGTHEEHKRPPDRQATKAAIAAATGAGGGAQSGVRREVQPGPHESGPGAHPAADLPAEAEYGEDRPANRTTAPDQPPTQWEPANSGAPGDHYRDGHHRSATAPEKQSSATDPFAHAPTPGPNHIIPPGGDQLPPETRP